MFLARTAHSLSLIGTDVLVVAGPSLVLLLLAFTVPPVPSIPSAGASSSPSADHLSDFMLSWGHADSGGDMASWYTATLMALAASAGCATGMALLGACATTGRGLDVPEPGEFGFVASGDVVEWV